jgi:hypothetical protein
MDPAEQAETEAETEKGEESVSEMQGSGQNERDESGQVSEQAGAKETSNNHNQDREEASQDKQDGDDEQAEAEDEDEPTREEAAVPPAVIDTPRAPSRTLVGGLIASSKSMKPFRSPLSGRPSNHSIPTSSATPSKVTSSSSDNLARPAVTPFRNPASLNTPSVARRSSAASSISALNKPFRSPVVSRAGATTSKQDAAEINEDAASSNMTSFQLSTALPALERRLALLKNAKRLLAAREQNEDVADNTAHIKVLSKKWLAAGREAADMLYDLTKDAYDNLDNDERQRNGRTLNNNNRKSNNGYQQQSNGWGWDTKNEQEEKQARIKAEMDKMDDEQLDEYIQSIDREEERDPLPDISDLKGKDTKKRSSTAGSGDHDYERRKKARLEEQENERDREDVEYNSPPPANREEDEEEVSDSEPIDDPLQRGMARMLTQTGIECVD